MASATTANLPEIQKILYPKGISYLNLLKSPFYGMAKHTTNFTGSLKQTKVTLGDGTGGSSDFSQALANRGPSNQVTFSSYRKKDYVIGSLENELIMATKGDEGAVIEAMKLEFDLKGSEMGERIWRRFWGSEGGRLGEVSSISTNTIVLTNKADMRHFRKGKVVMFASDNGTGSSPSGDRTGTLTVSGVNIEDKTVTFTENVTTGIPAATAGDSIFNPGDYGQAPDGVLAWTPIDTPSTTFLGVDRSVAPEILGGFRYDGAGGDMLETINNAEAESYEYQTAAKRSLFTSGRDFARLMNHLEGKTVMPREVKGRDNFAEASYSGVCVYTANGEITVMADPGCPVGYAVVTDPADWEIASLGELPHFSEEKFQQESAADARQFRLRCFWNVLCHKPYNTTIITW